MMNENNEEVISPRAEDAVATPEEIDEVVETVVDEEEVIED